MNRLLFFLFAFALVTVSSPAMGQDVGIVEVATTYAPSEPGGAYELESRTVYQHDGVHVVESIDEVWDGTAWVAESRTTYSGDQYNLETGSFVWSDASADWEPVDRTTYDWYFDLFTGEKTVLASEIYSAWNGTSFVNESRTTYDYDDNRVIESEQTDNWSGSAWIPGEREVYTEENGQVVVTTQEFDGAEWYNTERVTWAFTTLAEFQALALTLAEASVHYEGFLMILATLPPSSYDYWTGTSWTPESRESVETDATTGLRTQLLQESYDGQAWSPLGRFLFNYNQMEQLTELSYQFADGAGSWATFQSESYTWNAAGDLESFTVEVFIGTEFASASRTDLSWRYISVDTEPEPQPVTHELVSAWPNPFNPTAQVGYHVATAGEVTVAVYDQLGRHIATLHDGFQAAGEHQVTFRADHLPSGNYIVRMTTPSGQSTRMVTLLK